MHEFIVLAMPVVAQTTAAASALGPGEGFLCGLIGGAFAELAGWFKLRTASKTDRPAYLTDKFYWVITTLMVFAGGVLVAIYIRSEMGTIKPILAVNIGASAPLIIQTLSAIPKSLVTKD